MTNGLLIVTPFLILLIGTGPVILDGIFGALWARSDCEITRVIDGDTVAMQCSDIKIVRGRLTAIDAAELNGECAAERIKAHRAKWMLRFALWRGQNVVVTTTGSFDRYRRALVIIHIDGDDLAARLLSAGIAVPYLPGQRHDWCQK